MTHSESGYVEVRENRHLAAEIKFLIESDLAHEVRAWARKRLDPDPHAVGANGDLYHTVSLYFDTDAFDVYYRRGSFGRSKYRIRRYNGGDTVFLERKLKTREMVSKRRSLVGIEQLSQLGNGSEAGAWDGSWFHKRLRARGLKAKCQISYLRTARCLMSEQGLIRLTVDEDLRAQTVEAMQFHDAGNEVIISKEQQILELKYRGEMPALFQEMLEEFQLKSLAVSKYRLASALLGCIPEEPTGGDPVERRGVNA